MPDSFSLDSYPLTIVMVSQRTSSAPSPLPLTKNWNLQHSQQDGRKSTADICTLMHWLGNKLEISLAVCQHWSCFSPQQRAGLLRLITCGRVGIFSTGNFLQTRQSEELQRQTGITTWWLRGVHCLPLLRNSSTAWSPPGWCISITLTHLEIHGAEPWTHEDTTASRVPLHPHSVQQGTGECFTISSMTGKFLCSFLLPLSHHCTV